MNIRASANYVIEVSDYCQDGFEAFWRRASREYQEVDFSGFVFDDDLGSPTAAKVIQVEEDEDEG